MKKAMGLVVAVALAVATIGVADVAFARGGGSGGSSGGSGGSSGGSSGPSSAPSAAAPSAPSPSSPSNLTDNLTDTTSVSAFPRFGVVIPGCTTTNFGSGGGTVPCPNR